MKDLFKKFLEFGREKKLWMPDQQILVAVSGGVDSMVLTELFFRAGIKIGLAHCNFQLRGNDSEKDEELVKALALKKDLPFFSKRFDTETFPREWKKGIQEAARELRYSWLEEIRSYGSFHAIATAHHANDNAETLLMNLFKGTGIAGLHGVPLKNGRVMRPLLFATREEISWFAKENEIEFREDVSNKSVKYLRNAVRLEILPAVEKHFPGVITRLSDTIAHITEAESLYRKEIGRVVRKLVETRGNDKYIPVNKLKQLNELETVFFEILSEYGFTPGQVKEALELLQSGSGKFTQSDTHKLIRDRAFLILAEKVEDKTDFFPVEKIPSTIKADGQQFDFTFRTPPDQFGQGGETVYINAAKLENPIIVRRWRQGDYFYPLGMEMKKKKLSRFLIDQKVPLHEKEKIWVLESNRRIVWVAGYRLDERFKVKPGNGEVIRVSVKKI